MRNDNANPLERPQDSIMTADLHHGAAAGNADKKFGRGGSHARTSRPVALNTTSAPTRADSAIAKPASTVAREKRPS